MHFIIERGGTIVGAIDARDAQVHDGPDLMSVTEYRDIVGGTELAQDQECAVLHVRMQTVRVLVLDTLRGLTTRNVLRGFAARASAPVAGQDSNIRSVPSPIIRPGSSAKGPRERPLTGQNCTIILTDVMGFAAPARTEHDRLAIRMAIAQMLTKAILSPFEDACIWEDRGDGLLIIVHPDIPTMMLLDRLMSVLPEELRRHNEDVQPGSRIQLRTAVTVGPVVTDLTGQSGRDIICASRMLDTRAFKKVMASTGSVLGVITSTFVHDTAVETCPDVPGAKDYAPVRVNVKESHFAAWVRLFDPALIHAA
jgi:class 3 adenylate cyclase